MSEVRGFRTPAEGEERTYHANGWFSRGMWALALPVPDFLADGTTVWDIREGIYLAFPDGSCRLIARRDHGAAYRQWEDFVAIGHNYADHPDGAMRRQGDVFVVAGDPHSYAYPPSSVQTVEVKAGATLDRHVIVGRPSLGAVGGETLELAHPQHDTLGVMPGNWLVMMPGVSRPFSRRSGIGD